MPLIIIIGYADISHSRTQPTNIQTRQLDKVKFFKGLR
jgi:hypothetical protein